MTLCYVTRWMDYDNCALCSNVYSVLDLQHPKKKKSMLKHFNGWNITAQCTISATSQAQRSNGWNILPFLIQKSKFSFFPNASHVKGFGTIKKNSKQALTVGEKRSAQKNRRWETQKPQLWRQKEEREEGEKEERRRNRSRRRRWRPWLLICAGLLACCFNFTQPYFLTSSSSQFVFFFPSQIFWFQI